MMFYGLYLNIGVKPLFRVNIKFSIVSHIHVQNILRLKAPKDSKNISTYLKHHLRTPRANLENDEKYISSSFSIIKVQITKICHFGAAPRDFRV